MPAIRISPNNIDVFILCGGLGTRLKPVVPNKPKILAPIDRRFFLDILLGNLKKNGFKKIILGVGYLKEQIIEHCQKNWKNLNISFSIEKELLGTGGALKNSRNFLSSDPFLVMNGDTICPIDYKKFIDFHLANKAITSMAIVNQDPQYYGRVTLADSGQIINFGEKSTETGSGYMSAGIYLMQKVVFKLMPHRKKFSLEYNFFPKLVTKNFRGFISNNKFIDIGTPENYNLAIASIRKTL